MANTNVLTGNNGVVKIDNALGSPTALAAVRTFSVELSADTIETTVMGLDARTYIKGMSSWSGSADIYFDPTEMPTGSTGLTSLNPTQQTGVGAAPVTFEGYLNTTAEKFSGEVIVTGFTVNSSMDGLVEASVSFTGSGPLTFARS